MELLAVMQDPCLLAEMPDKSLLAEMQDKVGHSPSMNCGGRTRGGGSIGCSCSISYENEALCRDHLQRLNHLLRLDHLHRLDQFDALHGVLLVGLPSRHEWLAGASTF